MNNKKQIKLPQRKTNKSMSDKELLEKIDIKAHGNQPKGDMERLKQTLKNKLNNK